MKSCQRAEGRAFWVLLAVSLLLICLAENSWAAPDDPIFNDPEYQLYIQQLVIRAESNCMVPARGWGEKQRQIREGLKRSFGMDLPRAWPALEPRVESTLARKGYRIEQLSAQFWPGVWYAMQAYVPDGQGPFPAILLVATGTTGSDTRGAGAREPLFQQLGGGFARMGILVVGFMPLGKAVKPQTYEYGTLALLAGTSVPEEQYNTGKRALDYLVSRADVDKSRVGVTGLSLGGWETLYLAATDPRITAAAPGATNYTFTGYFQSVLAANSIMDGQEGWTPGLLTYGANIPMLAAMTAPKWLRFLNCAEEPHRFVAIPIIDGTAQVAYEADGVGDRYSSYMAPCNHRYCEPMQIESISWFCERFFGRRPASGSLTLVKVPEEQLQKRKTNSSLWRFFNLLVNTDGTGGKPIEIIEPFDSEWPAFRTANLDDDPGPPAFLHIIQTRLAESRASRTAYRQKPAARDRELRRVLGLDSLSVGTGVVQEGPIVRMETEPGLHISATWVRPLKSNRGRVSLVVGSTSDRAGVDSRDDGAQLDVPMRDEANDGKPLDPLLLLNRPPLGMWVWDAIWAAHWLRSEGFSRVELVGAGKAGSVIAVLAGTLTRDVDEIILKGRCLGSLDKDVVEAGRGPTPFWAHRLLWVADLPDLRETLKQEGRMGDTP
jgi:hypothetical protein